MSHDISYAAQTLDKFKQFQRYLMVFSMFPSHHNKQNDGGDDPRSKLVSQECLTKKHEQHECVPPVVAACPDRWSQADLMVLLHRPRSRHQHWSWGRGPLPLPYLQSNPKRTQLFKYIVASFFKSSWHIEHGAQGQKKWQRDAKSKNYSGWEPQMLPEKESGAGFKLCRSERSWAQQTNTKYEAWGKRAKDHGISCLTFERCFQPPVPCYYDYHA